jgi:outer membrane protein assembly factor BamB
MAAETTYLELSEDGGGSHKFYEVTVDGATVTVRFGRIGDAGQTKAEAHPTPEKARASAQKKIAEKRKKGYAPAVRGARQKRAATRRAVASGASTAAGAPVVWRFATGDRAYGLFVDEARCWVGNEGGRLFALDHEGKVLEQFRLPDGVKCIVSDDDWLYAGCDDGRVYDLGGKVPRVAYEIAPDVDVFWLDVRDGVLGVSDAAGEVVVVNHEDESQWRRQSAGRFGWMVRCDELGVYHGHEKGVTMYDWEDGSQLWHRPTDGDVLFGWQEESLLYAGTSARKVYRFTKRGEGDAVYACDARVFSCAASPDGRYVFAGDDCSSLYCFDGTTGARLWKAATGCGSAFSMQYFRGRLYVTTTDGSLACLLADEAAVEAARAGRGPAPRAIKAPPPVAAAAPGALETAPSPGAGVVLECYREGDRLRVRAASPGYDPSRRVQFPKDIRREGARYVVDGLREASRGGFYRVRGDIKGLA